MLLNMAPEIAREWASSEEGYSISAGRPLPNFWRKTEDEVPDTGTEGCIVVLSVSEGETWYRDALFHKIGEYIFWELMDGDKEHFKSSPPYLWAYVPPIPLKAK